MKVIRCDKCNEAVIVARSPTGTDSMFDFNPSPIGDCELLPNGKFIRYTHQGVTRRLYENRKAVLHRNHNASCEAVPGNQRRVK